MQMLIEFRVFDTIVGDLVPGAQKNVGVVVQRLEQSGKMINSGIYLDGRAGFFVMNIEHSTDLHDLLGTEMYDSCDIKVHPFITLEQLKAVFEKNMKK